MEKQQKNIVFDKTDLVTSIIARQLVECNSNLYIFMQDTRHELIDYMPLFKYDDNSSWLFQFSDFNLTKLVIDKDPPIALETLQSHTSAMDLMDIFLSNPRILLTSDTPCFIDINNREVNINSDFGYSNISTNIYKWFIRTPVDYFYNYDLGKIIYKTLYPFKSNVKKTDELFETALNNFTPTDLVMQKADNDLNNIIANGYLINYEECFINFYHTIQVDYEKTSENAFVYPEINNIKRFNQYMKQTKADKKIKYIGPDLLTDLDIVNNYGIINITSIFKKVGIL